MDVHFVEALDGHNWASWRDVLGEALPCRLGRWPRRTAMCRRSPRGLPVADVRRRIGLSLGADLCWPICYEEILRRLDLAIPLDGDTIRFDVDRVTIEPFDLRQPSSYDLVVDRLTHWYTTSREWIKKAVLMDGLYVFNNPWAIQSMEKHTSYCAMMRLGMPIPDTWIVPPKDYEFKPDLAITLSRYARLFDLDEVGQSVGYPLFAKPYDGGGWAGVSRVDDGAALHRAYDESGTYLLHLQRAVEPHDLFVRCIGFGPQTRLVRYDPSAPLHDRYTMDDGHVPDDQRRTIVDTTLTINSFFGWEFNSCEALRQDGTWRPIDFANACPDSQVTSLHYHFPWLVAANLRWSIFCAATKRRMRVDLDWAPYFEIADTDGAVRGEAGRLRGDRPRALPDRRVRVVLRHPPRPPRPGRVGLLRHRDRARRRAPEGGDAVPGARGRRVHGAVLGPHPVVAGAERAGGGADVQAHVDAGTRRASSARSTVVRWGTFGTPVLVFPTAGGDAEEIERFDLVAACGELIDAGRVKLYSVDSVNGRVLLAGEGDAGRQAWIQRQFFEFLRHEVVPAIRTDCASDDIEVVAAGLVDRRLQRARRACAGSPTCSELAICMSGTFDLRRFFPGPVGEDYYESSPLHFVPAMEDGETLDRLRQRLVVLASGEGANEDIGESWAVADVLGAKGIPNRVDSWGPQWEHDWPLWRAMLPGYLNDLG